MTRTQQHVNFADGTLYFAAWPTIMTDFTRKSRDSDPAAAASGRPAGNPSSGIPAFPPFDMSPLLDTVEFARNAWMSFGVPSSLTPTMDPGEVERRIRDLKTIEQWLSTNLNLLRTSIQALELQHSALAALQTTSWPAPQRSAQTADAQTADRESATKADARQRAPKKTSSGADEARTTAGTDPEPHAGAPGFDASAWWDLLQRQFEQVSAAALQPAPADSMKPGGTESPSCSGRTGPSRRRPRAGEAPEDGAAHGPSTRTHR